MEILNHNLFLSLAEYKKFFAKILKKKVVLSEKKSDIHFLSLDSSGRGFCAEFRDGGRLSEIRLENVETRISDSFNCGHSSRCSMYTDNRTWILHKLAHCYDATCILLIFLKCNVRMQISTKCIKEYNVNLWSCLEMFVALRSFFSSHPYCWNLTLIWGAKIQTKNMNWFSTFVLWVTPVVSFNICQFHTYVFSFVQSS